MKFSDYTLSAQLKTNLEKMGFQRPTDIQYKCIPPIRRGEDVLAVAQTGTGKTVAFALPIIDALQRSRRKATPVQISALVMVPTRELALQITAVFQRLAKRTGVTARCIYGGVEQEQQIQSLLKGIDIAVATPGRVFDLSSQGYLHLDSIRTVVLDEADRMLAAGFYEDIQALSQRFPKRRQTLFFSATIDKKIKKLAYSLVQNAVRIQISPKDPVSKNVTHTVAFIEMEDKRFFLERLVKEQQNVKFLVFVRTKIRAERLKAAMERVGVQAITLHGDKLQKEREKVLQLFKTATHHILITTNVSARGIDFPNVDYVVNYDLPEWAEDYVHRVGRTGRGEKKGRAISFCSKSELPLLSAIERYTTVSIAVETIRKSDYRSTVRQSDAPSDDWRQLIKEEEAWKKSHPKKKKKWM